MEVKLLDYNSNRINFRINSYLPRLLSLFNDLNDDGRIDLFSNSVKNIKLVMTSNFVSSDCMAIVVFL